MNRSERIKSLIDEAGSGYVSVTFIKKDGSERQMTFNPKDVNDIKGTGDTSNVDANIFRVRDNTKQAWRSFDARRVIKIKSRGVTTEFND
jgi:flagellar basal body rod protein FlgC